MRDLAGRTREGGALTGEVDVKLLAEVRGLFRGRLDYARLNTLAASEGDTGFSRRRRW